MFIARTKACYGYECKIKPKLSRRRLIQSSLNDDCIVAVYNCAFQADENNHFVFAVGVYSANSVTASDYDRTLDGPSS